MALVTNTVAIGLTEGTVVSASIRKKIKKNV